MIVESVQSKIIIKNIMVGEVWLCSGQSNMQWGVGGTQNGAEEIQAANYPAIRLFTVPNVAAAEPADNCKGQWQECSPQTVGGFSAVGYFFGRKIHQALKKPVGLINSSWGGTPAESWTSRAGLEAEADTRVFVERFASALAAYPEAKKKYDEAMAEYERQKGIDPTQKQDDSGWEKPDFDDTAWLEMVLPQNWEKTGLNHDGVVWFRKTFEIPEHFAGKDLVLHLGPIDDNDITYWNGEKIGATNGWNVQRSYQIPAAKAKAGKTTVAVRVVDLGGPGGFQGEAEQMRLAMANGKDTIPLAGHWRYAIAARALPRPSLPFGPGHPWLPTSLYNGMIAPLIPFALRGVIWYQGESNADRARQYSILFPALIKDWRRQWGQGDFPFLFVQLANFMAAHAEPRESAWAELREAQRLTLALPHTGMAVAIDIGEANDIHPRNKQDVGMRLALWALARVYGQKDLVYSGPLYASHAVEGDKVRLRFTCIGSGLMIKDGETLKHFAIAGEDRKWVWAEARIEGDEVVVWSPQVAKPVAVRYAWADNPEGCNLFNREGLPAAPFSTEGLPPAP